VAGWGDDERVGVWEAPVGEVCREGGAWSKVDIIPFIYEWSNAFDALINWWEWPS